MFCGATTFLGSVSLHQKSTTPEEAIVRVFKYSAKLELKLILFLVLLFIVFAYLRVKLEWSCVERQDVENVHK